MESKTGLFKLGEALVEGRPGANDRDSSPKNKWKTQRAKCFSIGPTRDDLMNGLVGSRSLVNVTIGEIQHECLIDSGSQVTTISKSFHDSHLASHPICPLANLIEVEGAAGQRVPYIDYIEIDIFFPDTFTGSSKTVSTLALVVPDSSASVHVSVLIGTNALDVLYEGFSEEIGGPVLENCAYAVLIQHLHSLYKNKTRKTE